MQYVSNAELPRLRSGGVALGPFGNRLRYGKRTAQRPRRRRRGDSELSTYSTTESARAGIARFSRARDRSNSVEQFDAPPEFVGISVPSREASAESASRHSRSGSNAATWSPRGHSEALHLSSPSSRSASPGCRHRRSLCRTRPTGERLLGPVADQHRSRGWACSKCGIDSHSITDIGVGIATGFGSV